MRRHTLLTVLVCLTVLLAGCSGWGTDGPTDDEDDSNDADDLEEASADAENETDGDTNDTADPAENDTNENGTQTGSDTGDGSGDEPNESEDDGDTEEDTDATGSETDESNETDENESNDGGGTTLTVQTADVVTGDPVNADVIVLKYGGETIAETSGESATFDGLDDGEYELEVHQAQDDWWYSATLTIDGEDTTHVAEIDQDHIYWPGVEATVVDGDGDPVEGETVTFNGNAKQTDAEGTASHEIESSYTDEREIVVEYDGRSETFVFDWNSWDGEQESVTFETDGAGDEEAALALA
ncbi:hypothetical protein [Halalkalicoccus subterraneus]|uniref:hypothetical protein n=1 Tax=Halalkalicoccus subterraneus TaxID=2675002 RepID=UPI0013CF2874|nr:hypothetical protein [Halalkalicoccus subterraneus]